MSGTPQLLKVDTGGRPIRWIGIRDAVRLYVLDKVVADLGGHQITLHGGVSSRTGERSQITVSTIISVRDQSKVWDKAHTPALTRRALYLRDRGICMYCGEAVTLASMEMEHVVPQSQGGRRSWTNIVSSCERCNDRKRNRTPAEAGMQLLGVPYKPNTAEWLILNGRNMLADQMDYLTRFAPKRRM